MKTITVELSDETERRLRDLSDREQRAPEEVARDILRRRLTLDRFHDLCRESAPLALAAGYASEADVLADIS